MFVSYFPWEYPANQGFQHRVSKIMTWFCHGWGATQKNAALGPWRFWRLPLADILEDWQTSTTTVCGSKLRRCCHASLWLNTQYAAIYAFIHAGTEEVTVTWEMVAADKSLRGRKSLNDAKRSKKLKRGRKAKQFEYSALSRVEEYILSYLSNKRVRSREPYMSRV